MYSGEKEPAAISGAALNEWGMQMLLTAANGTLLWCAAMPCIVLGVWCNKSYIISVAVMTEEARRSNFDFAALVETTIWGNAQITVPVWILCFVF